MSTLPTPPPASAPPDTAAVLQPALRQKSQRHKEQGVRTLCECLTVAERPLTTRPQGQRSDCHGTVWEGSNFFLRFFLSCVISSGSGVCRRLCHWPMASPVCRWVTSVVWAMLLLRLLRSAPPGGGASVACRLLVVYSFLVCRAPLAHSYPLLLCLGRGFDVVGVLRPLCGNGKQSVKYPPPPPAPTHSHPLHTVIV